VITHQVFLFKGEKMKNYKLSKIKTKQCYTYKEICKLLGVCLDTVKRWVREGLLPIDKHSTPRLIHGSNLKQFLLKKSLARKCTLLPGQFYCLCCRIGVTPINNSVIESPRNKLGKNKRGIEYKGLCSICRSTIYRFGAKTELHCLTSETGYTKKDKTLYNLPLFKVG
jgi:excisionase family DNA binding protein